jgi:hypothetical protein
MLLLYRHSCAFLPGHVKAIKSGGRMFAVSVRGCEAALKPSVCLLRSLDQGLGLDRHICNAID